MSVSTVGALRDPRDSMRESMLIHQSPGRSLYRPTVSRTPSFKRPSTIPGTPTGISPRRRHSLEQSICEMKLPTPLLKFGKTGKGFRLFQLTPNLEALSWHSKNKVAAKTKVLFKDVKEIRFGQRTEKFRRNNRPDLDPLSFSLIYMDNGVEDTLDLVCKDEAEFQVWTRTLQALKDNTVPAEILERLKSAPASPSVSTPESKMVTVKKKGHQEVFQGSNDVYAFGWGEWGQNGHGEARNLSAPQLLENLLGKGAIGIASGWSHTTVLLETGAVLQYGNHLGTGLPEDFSLAQPVKISEKITVIGISCGHFHTCALSDKGQVMTWGCNSNGQLGHDDQQDLKEPKIIESLLYTESGEEIVIDDITCGANHTGARGVDGKVWTWGCGDHGVLGHNDTKDRLSPEIVKDLHGIEILRISCGYYHMFACAKSETFGWGWNGCGQLGMGHEEDQFRPVSIEPLRGNLVEDIACGAAHTVAVIFATKFKTRNVYSWGSNANGQLGQGGQGKKKRVYKPTQVPELKDIVIEEVACGAMHTVLRSDEGEIFTSGLNKHGQLGHGHTNNIDLFKMVDGLKGKQIRLLSCGGENTSLLAARAWVEDREAKDCMSCKVVFTFVIRKHHCRNCGGIFCSTCSNKKIAILKYGLTEPVRVCTSCYSKLGGR